MHKIEFFNIFNPVLVRKKLSVWCKMEFFLAFKEIEVFFQNAQKQACKFFMEKSAKIYQDSNYKIQNSDFIIFFGSVQFFFLEGP